MIGYRNLNLLILFYYFTLDTACTTQEKQERENEQPLDGNEFMKRIISGSKLNSKPKFLMFTAPYKLCEGECSDEKLAIGFPVYLGDYAKKVYKDTYIKNFNKKEPKNPRNKITHPPKTNSHKTNKKRRQTPSHRGSTTSTQPPMFVDEENSNEDDDKKSLLNMKIKKKTDCVCPNLDPNICYKKRTPAMRQRHKFIVDDIKKLFTVYRKTKDIT